MLNNKISLPVFITILALSQGSMAAESVLTPEERGAQILEIQLQRAQRLTELEYQAEVLERQARIAKAQEQIDKTVGLENTNTPTVSQRQQEAPKAPKIYTLPRVIELAKTRVKFQFDNGAVGSYQVGDTLPSGHVVQAISMVDGVKLQKDNSVLTVNYQW
ncbi:MAG: type IV pilus biogenesis protein PilP [Pseudomonadota bacterium]|nr:type IV pilus biogenesis protein PilP [Pseudomonadota bacterium]